MADAASVFDSHAVLTFTVERILNLDDPEGTSGLSILASFEQAAPPDSVSSTAGDGAVIADNPSITPSPLAGNQFTHTFRVSGSTSIGDVASSHLGWYNLSFNNASGDRYAVEGRLAYQLSATVSGSDADSELFLDYMNLDHSFTGSAYLAVSVFDLPDGRKSDSSVFAFTLGPSASESLRADVRINGNLHAVPVPAAVWLLASSTAGLAVIGRRKS
jgi:hypothetical protein